MEINLLTLEQVMSVQKTVRKYSQEYNAEKLWRKVPEKMSFHTFEMVIEFLIQSGKIMRDEKTGLIFWTYDPEYIRNTENKGLEVEWENLSL